VLYSNSSAIFKLTTTGKSTILHQFDVPSAKVGCAIGCGKQLTTHNFDGLFPTLIPDADGGLYGVATAGGAYSSGTVFKVSTDGTFALLTTFDSSAMGIPAALLAETGTGALLGIVNPYGNAGVYTLATQSTFNVQASLADDTVSLGKTTTLSWTSNGADSCKIASDIAGASSPNATIAGSESVTPRIQDFYIGVYGISVTQAADYVTLVQCASADGSVANAAVQLRLPSWWLSK